MFYFGFFAVDMRKFLSILFSLTVLVLSNGIQVMQHHCLWCGGERIEIIRPEQSFGEEASCCESHADHAHPPCNEDGCCEPRLIKLTIGLTSEEESHLKMTPAGNEVPPVTLYAVRDIGFSGTGNIWKIRHFPHVAGPPGTLAVPLRC